MPDGRNYPPFRDATSRPEWWSVAIAIAVTVAGCSFSLVSVSVLRRLDAERPSRDERMALVQLDPPRSVAVASDRPLAAAAPITSPSRPTSVARDRDLASPAIVPATTTSDTASGAPAAGHALPTRIAAPAAIGRPAAPFAAAAQAAVRLPGLTLLDSAARDSVERLAGQHEAKSWRTWTMPRSIVDEDWRREHERVSVRADEKRPWIVSGGPRSSGPVALVRSRSGIVGVSVPAPILASGPSRKQRARDSVVHAGNVERLARIFERARVRRDSLSASRDSTGP